MTRKRNIGRLAAIAGATVGIALLAGVAAARADELADLRANQQLLQQRIDQLAQAEAQAPPPPGTQGGGATQGLGYKAAPGRPAAGGSFPRSFLIPGTDTSIRVGGFVDFTALYFLQGGGNANGANQSSNLGQNGATIALPLRGGFVPGAPGGGFVPPSLNRAPSRNNGILEFSPQQSRIDIETRTPTAWGESRTFFSFDFAGCNSFGCQDEQQGGGDSIHPRLRFAYGTLGGFLAGQALSNFSDADADTESMDFGGAIGGTGGQRIPQVRYTVVGPYGSSFSVAAENPWTSVITPSGLQSTDLALSGTGSSTTPPSGTIPAICNGVPCTGAGGSQANPTVVKAPNLTFASYWAQPWGHVDIAGILRFFQFADGTFINDQKFVGYGGHISGDVHPGWLGWSKDDFQFSAIAGNAIGDYGSGGLSTLFPVATNFTVTTKCATPTATCAGGLAASNILFRAVPVFSTNGGYVHWWTPNLRTQIAAGTAIQNVPSQLIGPTQAAAVNKQLWNAFVTLVWNPVAFITTGIEFMHAQRIVVANLRGTMNAFAFKFRVAF